MSSLEIGALIIFLLILSGSLPVIPLILVGFFIWKLIFFLEANFGIIGALIGYIILVIVGAYSIASWACGPSKQ